LDLYSLRGPYAETLYEPHVALRCREAVHGGVMKEQAAPATRVAYIGGAGRSGSTVLALLLAQVPGFVAVGGLSNIWERGLRDNYLCGCGAHFEDCPFWNDVGNEAFGSWRDLDLDEVLRLRLEVARYRHVPSLLAPNVRRGFAGRFDTYADYMAALYRAVATVSGSTVVVDNSHDLPPALILRRTPGIRSQVIHLIRDSRGVAFSVSKSVLRAEATASRSYMTRFSATEASGLWLLANGLYHVIPKRSLPRLVVHYEALVASPTKEISRVAKFLGEELSTSDLAAFGGDSIEVAENHMISGNPHRLERRQMSLRLDEEWRRKMSPRDRRLVTLLTLPLALPYGYVGSRRR
jgi:Sulfotransferase family